MALRIFTSARGRPPYFTGGHLPLGTAERLRGDVLDRINQPGFNSSRNTFLQDLTRTNANIKGGVLRDNLAKIDATIIDRWEMMVKADVGPQKRLDYDFLRANADPVNAYNYINYTTELADGLRRLGCTECATAAGRRGSISANTKTILRAAARLCRVATVRP